MSASSGVLGLRIHGAAHWVKELDDEYVVTTPYTSFPGVDIAKKMIVEFPIETAHSEKLKSMDLKRIFL